MRLVTVLRNVVHMLAITGAFFSPVVPSEILAILYPKQQPEPESAGTGGPADGGHPEGVSGAPLTAVERELWRDLGLRM
jgi:hypothetical protein